MIFGLEGPDESLYYPERRTWQLSRHCSWTVFRVGLYLRIPHPQLQQKFLEQMEIDCCDENNCYLFAQVPAVALFDSDYSQIEKCAEDAICRSIPIDEHGISPGASIWIDWFVNGDALSQIKEQSIECVIRPFVVLREGLSEMAALYQAVSTAGCEGCPHIVSDECKREFGPHRACVRTPGRTSYRGGKQ